MDDSWLLNKAQDNVVDLNFLLWQVEVILCRDRCDGSLRGLKSMSKFRQRGLFWLSSSEFAGFFSARVVGSGHSQVPVCGQQFFGVHIDQ